MAFFWAGSMAELALSTWSSQQVAATPVELVPVPTLYQTVSPGGTWRGSHHSTKDPQPGDQDRLFQDNRPHLAEPKTTGQKAEALPVPRAFLETTSPDFIMSALSFRGSLWNPGPVVKVTDRDTDWSTEVRAFWEETSSLFHRAQQLWGWYFKLTHIPVFWSMFQTHVCVG